jgi:carboxymethylenebutenolidase
VTGVLTSVTTPDGTAEAWLSRPDDGDPHPGVLLFMDAIGLRPRIFEMANRIASWGYVVLAPNVFYRDGTAEETTPSEPLVTDEARAAFFDVAMPRVRALTPELALRDIDAYLRALTARADVRSPVGVTGYCMGARLAVRAACAHPGTVVACGGFHGAGLAAESDDSPHLGLGSARARFAFGHAD